MPSRKHHYLVAHKLLPLLLYHDPIKFLVSTIERKDEYAKDIWIKAGEKFIEDPSDRLPPTNFCVKPFNKGQIFGAIFVFPEPQAVTEAHMTCALGKLRQNDLGEEELKNCRYITLEYGEYVDGSPRTVLCAWEKNERHLNFGDGPENDFDVFLNTCLSLCQ